MSALSAVGSSLLFMLALPAEAAGSRSCQFGTPESDLYQLLPTCSSRPPLILGDKRLTLNAPTGASAAIASLFQLPTLGSGAIKFSWQEIGSGDSYLNDIWSVSVDFDPDVYAPPTTAGSFKYTLEVIDPNWVFATVDLDSVKTESQGQVGGKIEISKLLPEGTLFPDEPLVSINGSNVDPVAFAGEFTSIAVNDTYALTGGSSGFIILDNFQNNFTQQRSSTIPPESSVPGPLPLLGAGAAFSVSRRLRSRLLAVSCP